VAVTKESVDFEFDLGAALRRMFVIVFLFQGGDPPEKGKR
jgi:hypothetical protein